MASVVCSIDVDGLQLNFQATFNFVYFVERSFTEGTVPRNGRPV